MAPVRNIPATVASAVVSHVTADTSYIAGLSVTPINQAGAITSSAINDSATVTSTAVTHNSVTITTGQCSIASLDNSSLGVITAMQSTIGSLQSTVTQLMTEKSTKWTVNAKYAGGILRERTSTNTSHNHSFTIWCLS